MKIQQLTPLQQNKQQNKAQNKQVAFKGFGDVALRFLDTNQAWGANAVDFGFMVTPRTAVDFTRGPQAGLETARREASGTVNHSLIGLYGLAAGTMLALPFNAKYGVKGEKVFASEDLIDTLGQAWHNEVQNKSQNKVKNYLSTIFDKVEGFDNSWKKLGNEEKDQIVNTLENEISNNKKVSKEGKNLVKALITSSTGSESNIRIKKADGKEILTTTADFVDDVFTVTKTFMKDKVNKVFEETKDFNANKFVKSLKTLNMKRSLLGLAIGAAVGMAIQPVNIYLTKKKTGSDKFVGGGEKDNSMKFIGHKLLAAGAFGAMTQKVIGGSLKELPKKLQFKGMSPTLNQFKFVYGLTIMSRLMSARNDDELREASIKDTLGFLNWLVLGNAVTKFAAKKLDPSLVQCKDNAAKGFKKFLNSHVVTRDEILIKDLGKKAFKGGKALSFNKMLEQASPAVKAQVKKLNIAQLLGYAYSGLVLGIGIPKLNIAITKHYQDKKAAKPPQTNPIFAQANIDFLNKKMSEGKTSALNLK